MEETCGHQRSTFFQHVKAQVYCLWLFCLLWHCRFLRFVERPRGDPLGRSAAAASTAVAVASSAGSVLPSFTSISFMGALEAVAGAAPALSAFAPWAAWVESSAGFGVFCLHVVFSFCLRRLFPDGCASGGGVCLRTAFHFRLGGDLAACAVGTAVLPTCGWVVTSPLVVAGLAPLFIPLAEQLALSRRSSRYCHALALASFPWLQRRRQVRVLRSHYIERSLRKNTDECGRLSLGRNFFQRILAIRWQRCLCWCW